MSQDYKKLDLEDPLKNFRKEFDIPQHNGQDATYLCGNSLGLRPKKAQEYVNEVMEDWKRYGVEGHLDARHPWLPYHEFLTSAMADVAGSRDSETVVMNTLSVNLHMLMVSFYRPKGEKKKILIEKSAFPSDQYAVASQARYHGYDPDEVVLELPLSEGLSYTTTEDACNFIEDHRDEIALIMLGGINYYSGHLFDFNKITQTGHENDCVVGFDMAHAAGNVEMNLHESGADFACWCTYKYLNSGPGSLSGVFIHDRHLDKKDIPRFEGWWGHNKENRFKMPKEFQPIPTAEAWQLSNPPILPMACIRASLEIFSEAGIDSIQKKAAKLSDYMLEKLNSIGSEQIEVITPVNSTERGAQLSIRVKNSDPQLYQKITEQGVVADWREPDVIRVAAAPLYNSYKDVSDFVDILEESMS